MVQDVKAIIEAALPDATVYVQSPDNTHFQAIVVSESFEGMPLVRQHQSVMRALKEAMREDVHAMQLNTFTPGVWEQKKHEFGIA